MLELVWHLYVTCPPPPGLRRCQRGSKRVRNPAAAISSGGFSWRSAYPKVLFYRCKCRCNRDARWFFHSITFSCVSACARWKSVRCQISAFTNECHPIWSFKKWKNTESTGVLSDKIPRLSERNPLTTKAKDQRVFLIIANQTVLQKNPHAMGETFLTQSWGHHITACRPKIHARNWLQFQVWVRKRCWIPIEGEPVNALCRHFRGKCPDGGSSNWQGNQAQVSAEGSASHDQTTAMQSFKRRLYSNEKYDCTVVE